WRGVCGPGKARATSISHQWICKERATRRLGRKEPPPGGLRPIWPGASLLVSHSPTAGDAPSSRLAPSQMGRNKRHWIYAHDHLRIVVEEELVGVGAQ